MAKAKNTMVKKKSTTHVKTYEEAVETKAAKNLISIIDQWVLKHSDLTIVIYSNWFIGIADKETTTQGIRHLHDSNAGSKDIALAVETYFHKKGMRIGEYKGGINAKTKHVYIHKVG